jgi:hypothetical protein
MMTFQSKLKRGYCQLPTTLKSYLTIQMNDTRVFLSINPKDRLILKCNDKFYLKVNNAFTKNAVNLKTMKIITLTFESDMTIIGDLNELEIYQNPYKLSYKILQEERRFVFKSAEDYYLKIKDDYFNLVNLSRIH